MCVRGGRRAERYYPRFEGFAIYPVMDSLLPTHFFSFFLLVLALPAALGLPAANGCLAYLGISAAPGSWPRSTTLTITGLTLATILHPLPKGSDQLLILIAKLSLCAIPGAALSWLWFPNVPFFSNVPSPPKTGKGSSTTTATDTKDEEEDLLGYGSATSDPKTLRQQMEISRLHEALATMWRNQGSAQSTDKEKYDKIIVKLEKEIAGLKAELETTRQQPATVTVTGKAGMRFLRGMADVALAAVQGLSNRSSPITAPHPRASDLTVCHHARGRAASTSRAISSAPPQRRQQQRCHSPRGQRHRLRRRRQEAQQPPARSLSPPPTGRARATSGRASTMSSNPQHPQGPAPMAPFSVRASSRLSAKQGGGAGPKNS